LKSFWLITTFPVSCISLLNKPPTFSVSCSYVTFIGFFSVFNDFWYSCINLSFFCFICFVFWLSRYYFCLCNYFIFFLIILFSSLFDMFICSYVLSLDYEFLFFDYTDLIAHVLHLLLVLIAHVLNHILVV